MTTTHQDLAAEARAFFSTRQRDSGESSISTIDATPDWVGDLVRDAHADFLPDDWRYSTIRAALDFIADNPDAEDYAGEFADEAVDVYSHARLRWLASNLTRASYVDDACEEFGDDRRGGILADIALGQYMEASEIYGSVWASLEQERQNREDA